MERATELRNALSGIVEGRQNWGAAVVTRDGIAVATRTTRSVSEDSFAAMVAAMLGAADAAMVEWADDQSVRATVEGRSVRITVQALDRDFLLAVAGAPGAPDAATTIANDAAAAQLRDILHGRMAVGRMVVA